MGILGWIVFGLIVGALAKLVMPGRDPGGFIVTTLLGIGGYPGTSELNMGMPGMHGMYWNNIAIGEADLIMGIGMRFDDRVTGSLKDFAPKARIVHIDIDPAEIGKNLPTSREEEVQVLLEESGEEDGVVISKS